MLLFAFDKFNSRVGREINKLLEGNSTLFRIYIIESSNCLGEVR